MKTHVNNGNDEQSKIQDEINDLENETSILQFIIERKVDKDGKYCNSTKAVEDSSCYNTKTRVAVLNFKIPKGHTLTLNTTKSKLKKNKLFFDCDGNGTDYDQNTVDNKQVVKGLMQKKDEKLKVYLRHHNYKNNCETTNNFFGNEIHKGSIVQGEPVTPCKE